MPLAAIRGRHPPARPRREITRSQGMSKNSPVATGLRRPEASASPSIIFSQVSTPSACSTGAASSAKVTPSASASASSCSSAGIYFPGAAIDHGDVLARRCAWRGGPRPWRYCRRPPMTAILPPTAMLPALTPFIHWMAPATSPGDVQLPGFHAPTANRMGVAHLLQLGHGGGGRARTSTPYSPSGRCPSRWPRWCDAEGGGSLAGYAAQALLPLENGGLDTGSAQEIGGGDAGGAAADDGGLLARHLGGRRMEAIRAL